MTMARYSLPDYRQRVDPDKKILKSDDYRVLLEAQDVLDNLRLQLQQMQQQNEEVFQQTKAAAYEEGLKEAKLRQAEQIFTTATQVIDYVSSVEQTLVKIVMTTIRRVFSDYDDAEIVAHLVQKSLQQFRDQSRLRIHVPATDNARQMREKIEEVLAPAADLALAEIIESPTVGSTGCRLESEMGSVESDLETLLQAMETALNEHFAARR